MASPARTITVALDMSYAIDTLYIHTLIRKLLQTKIPGTIIKFIANYIKSRKAYTTYLNHTSLQRQFKTGMPQGDVLYSLVNSIRKKQKLYCAFIDFSTAFDSVDRDILYDCLTQSGISSKMLKIIIALYSNTSSCVKTK